MAEARYDVVWTIQTHEHSLVEPFVVTRPANTPASRTWPNVHVREDWVVVVEDKDSYRWINRDQVVEVHRRRVPVKEA